MKMRPKWLAVVLMLVLPALAAMPAYAESTLDKILKEKKILVTSCAIRRSIPCSS